MDRHADPPAGIGDTYAGTSVDAKVTYTVEYDGQVYMWNMFPPRFLRTRESSTSRQRQLSAFVS